MVDYPRNPHEPRQSDTSMIVTGVVIAALIILGLLMINFGPTDRSAQDSKTPPITTSERVTPSPPASPPAREPMPETPSPSPAPPAP